jgi:phage terminase large subunit-like protein
MRASFDKNQAAENQSDAYDWIEGLFEQLGEFCARLEQYTKVEGSMISYLEKKMTGILTL